MPTGLKNSDIPASGLPQHLVQMEPRRAINKTVKLIFRATGKPQNFPGIDVPPGLSVALRGHNGTTGNTATVRVALRPEALNNQGGRAITPDTEIGFPVDHTAQIWAVGTEGDGLIATISGTPIG